MTEELRVLAELVAIALLFLLLSWFAGLVDELLTLVR